LVLIASLFLANKRVIVGDREDAGPSLRLRSGQATLRMTAFWGIENGPIPDEIDPI
jgi:hypothetical protein